MCVVKFEMFFNKFWKLNVGCFMVYYGGRCVEVCRVFCFAFFLGLFFLVSCHMKINLPEVLKLVYVYT